MALREKEMNYSRARVADVVEEKESEGERGRREAERGAIERTESENINALINKPRRKNPAKRVVRRGVRPLLHAARNHGRKPYG